MLKSLKHFNSTMVRLKVRKDGLAETAYSHFNSTMVRLKGAAAVHARQSVVFQFHYGTIKSDCELRPYDDEHNFNSTMVRLKVSTVASLPSGMRNFNSTMVRLKGKPTYRLCTRLCISIPLWYD